MNWGDVLFLAWWLACCVLYNQASKRRERREDAILAERLRERKGRING